MVSGPRINPKNLLLRVKVHQNCPPSLRIYKIVRPSTQRKWWQTTDLDRDWRLSKLKLMVVSIVEVNFLVYSYFYIIYINLKWKKKLYLSWRKSELNLIASRIVFLTLASCFLWLTLFSWDEFKHYQVFNQPFVPWNQNIWVQLIKIGSVFESFDEVHDLSRVVLMMP